MLIDPDFFDHWRTIMLIELLEDDRAPIYIMRLWAHAQTRRSDTFDMPPAGLAAQCRYKGCPKRFESALTEAGFIERTGSSVLVCGWAERNAALISRWTNGTKGGRKKAESKIQAGTESKPKANRTRTEPEPAATGSEPIREEKIRVDQIREDLFLEKEKHPGTDLEPRDEAGTITGTPKTGLRSDQKDFLSISTSQQRVALGAILGGLGESGEGLREKFLQGGFDDLWTAWVRHRDSVGKPLREFEAEQQLIALSRFSVEEASEVVAFSIQVGARNLIMNGDHKKGQTIDKEFKL